MSESLSNYLSKVACVTGVFAMMAFATPVFAADTCVGVVGNLVGANCGFDNGTTGWVAFGGIGTITTSSANLMSPSGNPYGVITPNASSQYFIRSPLFSLTNGTTYNVKFNIRADTDPTGVGLVQLTSAGGPLIPLVSGDLLSTGDWNSYNFTITASANAAYQFQIISTGVSVPEAIAIDGFVVVPVPEPASMILLGSLCSAVVGYKYRRKDSAC